MDTETGTRHIVVGYEHTAEGIAALDWALDEARRRELPVRAVIVMSLVYEPVPLGGLVSAVIAEKEDFAVEAAKHAADVAPTVPFSTVLVYGGSAGVLVDESASAELLVVGRGTHRALGEAFAGSTSTQVVGHAKCPVVVVERANLAGPAGSVIVGVDASPNSEAALGFAFESASRRGMPLKAVHAWHLGVPDTMALPWLDQETVDSIDAAEQTLLTDAVERWSEKFPDVSVTTVVSKAPPVDAMIAQAHAGDLLVVGSRGRGGFAGLVLGSVSQGLLHRPRPCPLVVVHHQH